MYLPKSTYRFQVNSTFKLNDVKKLIPYLKNLGISTIYSAPFFTSTKGSNHGYDGTNPDIINPEIGTIEELKEIHFLLKENKMDWLQDIVPNHMAFSAENVWLMDIFEKGKHSEFYDFFDIDWNHPDPELKGKVLAPFLGGETNDLISNGELKIVYLSGSFFIDYYGMQYPICWKSYYKILSGVQISKQLIEEEFNSLKDQYKTISDRFDSDFSIANALELREKFHYLYEENNSLKDNIDSRLKEISKDLTLFNTILAEQYYKLSYYMVADTKINFRRFFVVSQLICLKMEDEKVFKRYHAFIKSLIDCNYIQGLRIDHIDGLADPKKYLERLRSLVGEDTYIIVEKILESEEKMPDSWPIQGTSGYEFLAIANHLFTKPENKEKFLSIYKDFTSLSPVYEDLVREKKSYMLQLRMGGELENLVNLLLATGVDSTGLSVERIKKALFHILVSFSVYRSYVDSIEYTETDKTILHHALNKALELNSDFGEELGLIGKIIFAEGPNSEAYLKFYMRLQQFTGPLAAKGVEDTTFYIYNRLISHNEVGDSPKSFGVTTESFHSRMKERLKETPYSINTTSTHDTKRGEDGRARINVLSEIPDEWQKAVFKWKEISGKHKVKGDIEMPDSNDEYFIYQSILGGFPMDGEVDEDFVNRTKDFMQKALREAKVHTDFPDYNEKYEAATSQFIEAILNDKEFLNEFLPFFNRVSDYAVLQSLGLVLLKITAPGIPDTYQGSELWDLSYVDPDNRRVIDYKLRENYLKEITESKDRAQLINHLVKTKRSGQIKLFTSWITLNDRNLNFDIYKSGDYQPLTFSGEGSERLVGFTRSYNQETRIVIFPRESKGILNSGELTENSLWKDVFVNIPDLGKNELLNLFTEKAVNVREGKIKVSELLNEFPLALLK